MDTTLLATKLRIPSQPHRVVERARLNDALEENIPLYKLLLISAPAGYGKTTMLGAWAHASRFPIVWLALGEDDNDLDRLLRYLLAGWEKIQPGVQESPLGLLLSAMEPEREAVLAAFVNAADSAPDHLVVVFDDYHLIDDSTIHEALTFLLDHLPSTIHFVLASCAEPPLPLARYRASHQLLELRATLLNCTREVFSLSAWATQGQRSRWTWRAVTRRGYLDEMLVISRFASREPQRSSSERG